MRKRSWLVGVLHLPLVFVLLWEGLTLRSGWILPWVAFWAGQENWPAVFLLGLLEDWVLLAPLGSHSFSYLIFSLMLLAIGKIIGWQKQTIKIRR